MLSVADSEIDQLTAELGAIIDRVQRFASRGGERRASLAVAALRAADRLTAAAATTISRGGFASGAGVPAPIMLQMDARATSWDARALTRSAAMLDSMPNSAHAFQEGLLSWSQVRGICNAARSCDAAGRRAVDRLVARDALFLRDADPDQIVRDVEDLVAELKHRREERHEQQAVDRSFVTFQPRLDGRTFFYGEGDTVSVATLIEAADTAAAAPSPADTLAQRRYDALIAIAEQHLGGSSGSNLPTRSRPRLLATIDVADLTRDRREASARILWAIAGRAPRLSPLGTETLACDADVLPILFERGTPVAVGDATSPIPPKIRRAVAARDRGCRFPGCNAPLSWADAHHIRARRDGGTADPDNLVMLCRRCHHRVHRRGWTITRDTTGSLYFARRGARYHSPLPGRAPPRE